MMLPSRLGCPLSLKTANMGNPGFITRGAELIILLCGGNKDSQRRDIARAKRMATEWRS